MIGDPIALCLRCNRVCLDGGHCVCESADDFSVYRLYQPSGPRTQACPFRGYLEFFEAARDEPYFRNKCAGAFDWAAHYAMELWLADAPQRWAA